MSRWLAPLAVVAAVAALWWTTLPRGFPAANDPHLHPSGLVDPLLDDSGEFVVAWHTWGVTHPPGYPLLGAVANALTRFTERLPVGRTVAPVTRAALVSWLFAVLTLVLVVALVLATRAEGQVELGVGAGAAVILFAFGGMAWLYAVVAEVYSFALFLAFAALVTADRLARRPSADTMVLLGLLFGLAVGHHRTLLVLAPALVVAAWPGLWKQSLGVWAQAGSAVVVGVLAPYLYLPLVAKLGSVWVYGRSPATWAGFSDALFAREYLSQLAGSLAPAAILHSAGLRLGFLAAEMTPLGLTLGLLGLAGAVAWSPSRRLGIAFLLIVAAYVVAPVTDKLVIGTHLSILLAALVLAASWGLALVAMDALGSRIAWMAGVVTVLAAGFAYFQHRQAAVLDYTTERLGDRIVAAAADLVRQQGPDQVTLAEAWGPRYFAFAYGKWVTGALSETRLIDVRADLSGLPAADQISGTLVTTQDLLYLAPPSAWSAKIGRAVSVESAGDDLVAMRTAPRTGEVPGGGSAAPPPGPSAPIPFIAPEVAVNPNFWPASRDGVDKTGILVVGAAATIQAGGDLDLRVEWQAERKPPADFHVYVYVSDRPSMAAPADILAQADRGAPVYGFSPTSAWTPGQRVRDDYHVMRPPNGWPKGRAPKYVIFGLYRDVGDGQTEKLSRAAVELGLNAAAPAATTAPNTPAADGRPAIAPSAAASSAPNTSSTRNP